MTSPRDYDRLENVAVVAMAIVTHKRYRAFLRKWSDEIGGSAGLRGLAIAAGEALTAYEYEHPMWWDEGGDWLAAVVYLTDLILKEGPAIGMVDAVQRAVRMSINDEVKSA